MYEHDIQKASAVAINKAIVKHLQARRELTQKDIIYEKIKKLLETYSFLASKLHYLSEKMLTTKSPEDIKSLNDFSDNILNIFLTQDGIKKFILSRFWIGERLMAPSRMMRSISLGFLCSQQDIKNYNHSRSEGMEICQWMIKYLSDDNKETFETAYRKACEAVNPLPPVYVTEEAVNPENIFNKTLQAYEKHLMTFAEALAVGRVMACRSLLMPCDWEDIETADRLYRKGINVTFVVHEHLSKNPNVFLSSSDINAKLIAHEEKKQAETVGKIIDVRDPQEITRKINNLIEKYVWTSNVDSSRALERVQTLQQQVPLADYLEVKAAREKQTLLCNKTILHLKKKEVERKDNLPLVTWAWEAFTGNNDNTAFNAKGVTGDLIQEIDREISEKRPPEKYHTL